MNVGHVKKLLVPNQMRYQAALRPDCSIYIGYSMHFNHNMRVKSELNKHNYEFVCVSNGERDQKKLLELGIFKFLMILSKI